jgi:hypothetical protein
MKDSGHWPDYRNSLGEGIKKMGQAVQRKLAQPWSPSRISIAFVFIYVLMYHELSNRVLLIKISGTEKFINEQYLNVDTHSLDVSGSIDEGTFPLSVTLFC